MGNLASKGGHLLSSGGHLCSNCCGSGSGGDACPPCDFRPPIILVTFSGGAICECPLGKVLLTGSLDGLSVCADQATVPGVIECVWAAESDDTLSYIEYADVCGGSAFGSDNRLVIDIFLTPDGTLTIWASLREGVGEPYLVFYGTGAVSDCTIPITISNSLETCSAHNEPGTDLTADQYTVYTGGTATVTLQTTDCDA